MLQAISATTVLASTSSGASFAMTAPQLLARLDSSILFQADLNLTETARLAQHMLQLGSGPESLVGLLSTPQGTLPPSTRNHLRSEAFLATATEPGRTSALERFVHHYLDVLDDPERRRSISSGGAMPYNFFHSPPLFDYSPPPGNPFGVAKIDIPSTPSVRFSSDGYYRLFGFSSMPGAFRVMGQLRGMRGRSLRSLETLGPLQWEGELYEGALFPNVELVRTAWRREPSPNEQVVFKDILDVMPADISSLSAMVRDVDRLDLKALSPAQAREVRLLAWVLYKLADEQMAQTNRKRAEELLTDAVSLLEAWQRAHREHQLSLDPSVGTLTESVLGVWSEQNDMWQMHNRSIDGLIDAATSSLGLSGRQLGVRQLSGAAEVVASYLMMGYPMLAHQILHYDIEPHLTSPEQNAMSLSVLHYLGRDLGQDDFDPQRQEAMRQLKAHVEAIHEKTHWQTYQSAEWMPNTDERGRSVYRWNAIMIRNMVVSMRTYLGLDAADEKEIYETASGEQLFPIQDATDSLYAQQQGLVTLFEHYDNAEPASAYSEYRDLNNIKRQVEQARASLANKIESAPAYLSEIFASLLEQINTTQVEWLAAFPEGKGPADILSQTGRHFLDAAQLLMDMGDSGEAHETILKAEKLLGEAAQMDAELVAELLAAAEELHIEIHLARESRLVLGTAGIGYYGNEDGMASYDLGTLTGPRAITADFDALGAFHHPGPFLSAHLVGGARINPATHGTRAGFTEGVGKYIVRVSDMEEALRRLSLESSEDGGVQDDGDDD